MYCPDCGSEIAEGKTYCGDCGKKVTSQKERVWNPDPFAIGFGVLIILIMYFLPAISIGRGGSIPLAGMFNLCFNNPFPVVSCPQYISWLFFGGWVSAIILVIFGILNKTQTDQ